MNCLHFLKSLDIEKSVKMNYFMPGNLIIIDSMADIQLKFAAFSFLAGFLIAFMPLVSAPLMYWDGIDTVIFASQLSWTECFDKVLLRDVYSFRPFAYLTLKIFYGIFGPDEPVLIILKLEAETDYMARVIPSW